MRRRLPTVVAALALLAGGCTVPPSEPPTSAPTGPVPSVEFTASIEVRPGELRISYRLVNRDDHDLYVLNQVSRPDGRFGGAPGQVYVTGYDDRVVEISMRAFDMPPNVFYDSPAHIAATRIAPGEEVAEAFPVALPLARRHPYRDDAGEGPISLPDPVESVLFCVGVVGVPPPPHAYQDLVVYDHMPATTRNQHVFCSEVVALS